MPPVGKLLHAGSRAVAVALVCVAALSLLGGASCVIRWGDDDDDHCHDDDAGNDAGCDDSFEATTGDGFGPSAEEVLRQLATLPALGGQRLGDTPPDWLLAGDVALLAESLPEEAYRLGDVRVVPGDDPRRHPDARLLVRDGPALADLWRLAVWSPADLTLFAERVARVNDDRLGLPPTFGALRHAGTYVLDTVVAVVHQQVAPVSAVPLEGARRVLVFDGHGRLLQVENELVVPPGLPTPAPDAWSRR